MGQTPSRLALGGTVSPCSRRFALQVGAPETPPTRPCLPSPSVSFLQVAKVFNVYTDGTGLKVVQLTGQKSFAKEQESLAEET